MIYRNHISDLLVRWGKVLDKNYFLIYPLQPLNHLANYNFFLFGSLLIWQIQIWCSFRILSNESPTRLTFQSFRFLYRDGKMVNFLYFLTYRLPVIIWWTQILCSSGNLRGTASTALKFLDFNF